MRDKRGLERGYGREKGFGRGLILGKGEKWVWKRVGLERVMGERKRVWRMVGFRKGGEKGFGKGLIWRMVWGREKGLILGKVGKRVWRMVWKRVD